MSKNSFECFIGQVVKVNEIIEFDVIRYVIDESDPTIVAIRIKVVEEKLKLRIWLPASVGTRDARMDRMNVKIEKVDDSWKITRVYIG